MSECIKAGKGKYVFTALIMECESKLKENRAQRNKYVSCNVCSFAINQFLVQPVNATFFHCSLVWLQVPQAGVLPDFCILCNVTAFIFCYFQLLILSETCSATIAVRPPPQEEDSKWDFLSVIQEEALSHPSRAGIPLEKYHVHTLSECENCGKVDHTYSKIWIL